MTLRANSIRPRKPFGVVSGFSQWIGSEFLIKTIVITIVLLNLFQLNDALFPNFNPTLYPLFINELNPNLKPNVAQDSGFRKQDSGKDLHPSRYSNFQNDKTINNEKDSLWRNLLYAFSLTFLYCGLVVLVVIIIPIGCYCCCFGCIYCHNRNRNEVDSMEMMIHNKRFQRPRPFLRETDSSSVNTTTNNKLYPTQQI